MPITAMHTVDPVRAETLLRGISGVRVLVVGDLMLDVYLRGAATRISPEAPVPVVTVDEEWRAPGGAANVAANLVALGARVSLVGAVGDDPAADLFMAACRDHGVQDTGVVRLPGRPTTVKTRVMVGHHQVSRYDRETDRDVEPGDADTILAAMDALADSADAIVLEDYDKGVLVPAVIQAALDTARRRGLPVVVDPKARRFFEYVGCTVFKPNGAELASALRAPIRPEDAGWMEHTRRELGCEHLLVTLGPGGMALVTAAGDGVRTVPAVARSVYDVSGAGDTVTAVIAAGLAAGGSIEECAVLATHAAGVEVGKAGVATVAPDEILDSVRHGSGADGV